MNATHRLAIAALLALVGGCLAGSLPSAAQAPDTGSKQPPYTMAEYNAYQAACSEKSPQQQIRLLDDFVSKYPGSARLCLSVLLPELQRPEEFSQGDRARGQARGFGRQG